MSRWLIALAAATLLALSAQAAPPIPARKPLAVIPIAPGKAVSRVETTEVDFLPDQAMPTHKHTVPVICFVSKGAFRVKIGEAPERLATVGTTTYEPPGVTVHYFKNASATAHAELLCASLAGSEDKVLNVMLDPEPIP
ncbi:MAG TPA: cupin domain-containing protein [Phenylobacterium sp.]|jgi:quercetin dioxygenase-like cupin family protein|uniref:cupin domain-containing protein n=1 Tax=Phenylobacterium sp. TaxID=1871053 RepID=UPI002D345FCB|nr:cupin domain-containing protein [Phenylobacterium sp.]HZZ67636.1 cupin domain-containing protein [Phenylobacterium sp.]